MRCLLPSSCAGMLLYRRKQIEICAPYVMAQSCERSPAAVTLFEASILAVCCRAYLA